MTSNSTIASSSGIAAALVLLSFAALAVLLWARRRKARSSQDSLIALADFKVAFWFSFLVLSVVVGALLAPVRKLICCVGAQSFLSNLFLVSISACRFKSEGDTIVRLRH